MNLSAGALNYPVSKAFNTNITLLGHLRPIPTAIVLTVLLVSSTTHVLTQPRLSNFVNKLKELMPSKRYTGHQDCTDL